MCDAEELRLPDAPYAFRPAKRIQRIMFCDALRCLRTLRPLEEYQYVGLGHWQFVDFELMRREVGIRKMVSLEKDSNQQERYEQNAPFDDITLLFGDAYESLQSDVDLSMPTIAWLDYTRKFEDKTVRDLRYLVERLPGGSVLAATFNCRPDRDGERVQAFERHVGGTPGDLTEDDLDRDGLPRTQRQILVERLAEAADGRGDGAQIRQFMFLRYQDRTPMAFWAAILATDDVDVDIALASLERLEQHCEGAGFLDVSVPFLSTKEVIELNKAIQEGGTPSIRGVDRPDCEAYERWHRWYPPVPLPF